MTDASLLYQNFSQADLAFHNYCANWEQQVNYFAIDFACDGNDTSSTNVIHDFLPSPAESDSHHDHGRAVEPTPDVALPKTDEKRRRRQAQNRAA